MLHESRHVAVADDDAGDVDREERAAVQRADRAEHEHSAGDRNNAARPPESGSLRIARRSRCRRAAPSSAADAELQRKFARERQCRQDSAARPDNSRAASSAARRPDRSRSIRSRALRRCASGAAIRPRATGKTRRPHRSTRRPHRAAATATVPSASSQCAAAPVSAAVITTPSVASNSVGASTPRNASRRVRRPPSNRITASANEPRR